MRAAGIEPFSKALRNRRADALPNGLWHTKLFKDNSLVETLGSMSGTHASTHANTNARTRARTRARTQKDQKTKKTGKKWPQENDHTIMISVIFGFWMCAP